MLFYPISVVLNMAQNDLEQFCTIGETTFYWRNIGETYFCWVLNYSQNPTKISGTQNTK